jgi:hypothetical protein
MMQIKNAHSAAWANQQLDLCNICTALFYISINFHLSYAYFNPSEFWTKKQASIM